MKDRSAYKKRKRDERKMAGQCVTCGKQLPDGYERMTCPECAERRKKRYIPVRARYDDHPEIIKLCMNCKYKDCIGRCKDWQRLQADLEKRDPNYVNPRYYKHR